MTLDDPTRLIPVTGERIQAINVAARELSARDNVRVVVVTGAGRGFCSGADLSRGFGSRRDGGEQPATYNFPPASGSLL